MSKLIKKYDVAVIGGGPAGLMAAGRAAEKGAKVVLLEQNDALGRKLLLTGGGRCNLTNSQPDTRTFLSKFGVNSKFLFSPFSQFDVQKTRDFFEQRGLATKIEEGGRVFPVTDQAQSVLDVLLKYIAKGGVEVILNAVVSEVKPNENKITLTNSQVINASSIIVATGGKSHPETGSTGDGIKWLKDLGHRIVTPSAALVPIKIKEKWVHDLQGVTLSEAKLTIFSYDKKIASKKGKILFTHFGLTGPLVLNMSKKIGETLAEGGATLELDILPNYDYSSLNTKLQDMFNLNRNKKVKNVLPDLVFTSLVTALEQVSSLDLDKEIHSFTREERLALVKQLKHLPMTVTSLLGVDQAIVTSGGIRLVEIDPRTMRSKLFPNLYVVGDMLDIDRPSGGFSLQLCWTTGYVAGNSVAE